MAGPNPHQLHSFRELRAVMGRAYGVCRLCRRFVSVGAWLDGLDTRLVTFSCSVCGGPGELTVEEPAKDGMQYDLRPNPARHPEVAARLQHMQQLANPFGRRPTVVPQCPDSDQNPRRSEMTRWAKAGSAATTFSFLAPAFKWPEAPDV